MFVGCSQPVQMRAKNTLPAPAGKRKPSLGKFRNFLLAGTASLMLLSSCGKEEAPPTRIKIVPSKRVEYIRMKFDVPKSLGLPLMKQQKRDGFYLLYSEDSFKADAERLAAEIEKYQNILPYQSRVKLAIVSNDFGDSTFNNDMVSLQVQENWLYARGNAPAFSSETRLVWSVFHEMSHLYMDYSLDSASLSLLETSYLSIMKLSRLPAYSDTLPPLQIDNHPLLGLFDESTYLKGAKPIYGHPEEGEWELFASASTVLKFSHEKFFTRVNQLKLKKRDRALYSAAMDFARLTVSLWGSARIFPGEVYAKLKLPLPSPDALQE